MALIDEVGPNTKFPLTPMEDMAKTWNLYVAPGFNPVSVSEVEAAETEVALVDSTKFVNVEM